MEPDELLALDQGLGVTIRSYEDHPNYGFDPRNWPSWRPTSAAETEAFWQPVGGRGEDD